ncbi:hypothetical protein IEZ26_18265 [Nocardioides cavernae]|uniref:Auto-transporter adhesin head GIN domain-containing protein n=1 Tax=Nocardioides cavernae TaxID=1921566 RepID=A0ABR8NEL3_9ACTN|nr:hypothetical protein [Nocardioides cavernae]MBD3926574.1 hypothetical protein [Nocardioides cavernae]MBM7512293.1 hypothetical protein [Nocardioides cavernae]
MISDNDVQADHDWSSAVAHTDRLMLSHSHELLDLSAVGSPAIELTVVGAKSGQMAVTPPSGTVKLPPDVQRLHIRMPGKRQGQLKLIGASHVTFLLLSGSSRTRSRLTLDAPSIRHLLLERIEVELHAPLQKAHRHTSSLRMTDASLTVRNRHVNDLLLTGLCQLDLDGTQVEKMMVPTATRASMSTRNCSVGLVKMSESATGYGSDSPTLTLEAIGGGKEVTFERMQNINVAVGRQIEVIVREADSVIMQGAGQVRVRQSARALRLKSGLVISADRGAQLIETSGEVTLAQVANSRITSDETHGPLVISKLAEGFEVSGLSIAGVEFPVTLEGLRLISIMSADAGHVVPTVPTQLRQASQRATSDTSVHARELELASNYAEVLSDLADKRGAPSSVRSELAWFRYRLRNLTAPERWERRLLSGYELLGYGEKFTAPGKLYLAVAAFAAGLCLLGRPFDPSIEGVLLVLHSYVDWLMTPLHLLKLGEGTEPDFELPQYLDQLFRALVAAPFVTAVLTVRKFVKR